MLAVSSFLGGSLIALIGATNLLSTLAYIRKNLDLRNVRSAPQQSRLERAALLLGWATFVGLMMLSFSSFPKVAILAMGIGILPWLIFPLQRIGYSTAFIRILSLTVIASALASWGLFFSQGVPT